jgi:hypothetical protein
MTDTSFLRPHERRLRGDERRGGGRSGRRSRCLPSLLAYDAVDPDAGVLTDQRFRTATLRSQQDSELDVAVAGSITVNGGRLGAQIEASNGIVHAIETALIP